MRLRRPPARPAARWSVPRLVAVLVLLTVLSGCTLGPSTRPELATAGPTTAAPVASSAAPTRPVGPGGPGRTADPISWTDCDSSLPSTDPTSGRTFALDCAQVRVPKSYSRAGSSKLRLAVTRARAEGLPTRAPELLVVLGDPGRHGTADAAAVAGGLPAEITAHFAIILVDLRGTGQSAGITCVSAANSADLLSLGPDPTTAPAAGLLAGLARELTFDCGDEVGPDLTEYSSVPAADDLDTVRAALGSSTLNYLGRGYGATLGAIYADRYPGRVGAMVLDGPTDPLATPQAQALAEADAAEQALTAFAAGCAAFTGGCPLGANPRTAVVDLVKKLGDLGVPDDSGDLVTGGSVLQTLLALLGQPDRWPVLARALASAGQGDVTALSGLLIEAAGGDDRRAALSARVIYGCNDAAQRLGGTQLTQAVTAGRGSAPLFAPITLSLVGLCADWPAPAAPLGRVQAAGAPPIVVVAAVDDPQSPYSGVRSLTGQLSSAVLVSWQSGRHGAYPASGCVTATVDGFLLKGTVPDPGTLCPP